MNREDNSRIMQKQLEELWKGVRSNQKRLDFIEPRETGLSGLYAYGEIYVHDNAVAQAIANGAAYTKSTAWGANGLSKNCTPNVGNNRIDIDKIGIYKVTCNISARSGTANLNWMGSIFLNAVEQNQIHWRRKIAAAGDEGSMGMSGFIDVTTSGWRVDVRFRHDGVAPANLTVTYGNLHVIYIGPT